MQTRPSHPTSPGTLTTKVPPATFADDIDSPSPARGARLPLVGPWGASRRSRAFPVRCSVRACPCESALGGLPPGPHAALRPRRVGPGGLPAWLGGARRSPWGGIGWPPPPAGVVVCSCSSGLVGSSCPAPCPGSPRGWPWSSLGYPLGQPQRGTLRRVTGRDAPHRASCAGRLSPRGYHGDSTAVPGGAGPERIPGRGVASGSRRRMSSCTPTVAKVNEGERSPAPHTDRRPTTLPGGAGQPLARCDVTHPDT